MNKNIFLIIYFIFSGELFSQSAAELYSSGMKAFQNKDYVEASIHFDKLLLDYSDIDEMHSAARYYSGESLLNLGEKQAAKERFEFLVNNFRWSSFRDAALYRLGLIYFDAKHFEQSRNRLNTLLAEYPSSEFVGRSLYWIGESYVEEDKIDDAIKLLEDAVSVKKGNRYIDYSIYTLANVHERKGDYRKAVEYYDQLLSFYKESKFASIAQFRIGYCYFKLKDYQSSVLELNNPAIKELDPSINSEATYLLANAHYQLSEFGQAESVLTTFVNEYPNSYLIRNAKYNLGWSYFQQNKYDDAYKTFDELSLLNDSIGVKSFYWKAESKRYSGRSTEALSLFNEFIKKYDDPNLFSSARLQVGGIYFSGDKFKDSEKYLLESASSDNPYVKSKAHVILGDMYLSKLKFDDAKDNFKAAVQSADTLSDIHSSALLGMGVSSFYLKQYNEAVKYLIDLENKEPGFNSAKVNFFLAESNFGRGNYSEAVKRFNKIPRDDRELYGISLYGKAYSYFYLRDYDNAALAFSDFIQKNPVDTRTFDSKLKLADSYYGNKNYSAAGRLYKEIFLSGEEKARDPYVQYQYAQALYKGGNSSEAISQFRILQSTYPESEFADKSLYIIGWIFFQKNSFNDAINSYRVLLNTYPSSSLNPVAYYSIGDAFFNLAKYDSAVVNYQKVLDQFPNSNHVFDAVNGIMYCFLAQNQDEKAIALVDDFVNKNPALNFSDEIYFKKGEIYYSQSSYEKAKHSYSEFVTRLPKSELVPAALYWIGKSAQNLSLYEEALINFNKVFNSHHESDLAVASVLEIGNIYNQQKKYESALEIYERGSERLSNSPQIAEILFMKAITKANKGDVGGAYEAFDDIVQYHSESAFADRSIFEIGLIEYSAKRYENAMVYFKSIAEPNKDELGAKAQYYLGLSLLESEKIGDAVSAFMRVRSIFSYYQEWVSRSALMLGECYVKLKDLEKAKSMFREVLAKHRGDELGKTAQKKLREIE